MYRALPIPKAAGAPSGRAAARVVRRRFATEAAPAPVPKKKKHVIRRFVIYSTAATATFYIGSAFIALKNPAYYDVFVERVPLGASVIQYAEDHDWDAITLQQVVNNGKGAVEYVRGLVTGEKGEGSGTSGALERTKEAATKTRETVSHRVQETKDSAAHLAQDAKERVKALASSLVTSVEKDKSKVGEKGAKGAAIARHQSAEFSDGVEELVRRAEAALANKPIDFLPEATTTPEQPSVGPPDHVPPRDNNDPETSPKDIKASKAVYSAPLPVGFEPPPGYARPAPPKPAPAPESSKKEKAPAPAPEPLPLVAPAVEEFGASEPVITHLASVIDNLASFLSTNPAAAEKAKDILDTAQGDLKGLAERIEQVKEEERQKLEAKLDEQTREFTHKLLELEMEAQDKLDSQEEDFRKFFEEERLKFVQAYREKLNRELQTQSEIINERLKEEVIAQGIELQRRWIREIKIRVEQERGGRLAKLDELATNLKRLERIALDNSAFLDENIRVHAMWSALRAVEHNADAGVRKPFREELRALRHIAAAREDPVVSSVLENLDASEVPDVGIEPFADLALWFTTSVAPRVSTVALVPDQNAGVLSHLASHLLSAFQFKRTGLVPGDDVPSTLARAEYYLNEKDLDSAARELNQLKGPARELLTDWLDAARKRLEVLQALQIVESQATLASLSVAQD
ncbi:hypothetical protein OBBRIDRAFT_836500 [Obba rivulosa]|uniref:MICOS complex subunit MIC60 n=1 Tax=Obba rivulosa TaxID=1052685 RepID=A0A8E2AZX2_9APHY|nr:hypothetical protein OBBRIDRAFT_836500 [Obba rivulosa]